MATFRSGLTPGKLVLLVGSGLGHIADHRRYRDVSGLFARPREGRPFADYAGVDPAYGDPCASHGYPRPYRQKAGTAQGGGKHSAAACAAGLLFFFGGSGPDTSGGRLCSLPVPDRSGLLVL